MKLTQYHVDAFASRIFEGNPAAVCHLREWLDDTIMQRIAAENNLAETAFIVPQGNDYAVRWFTPLTEVDLCGHATLASAYVLFNELGAEGRELTFHSKSGLLRVRRNANLLELDFPCQVPRACRPPAGLSQALGINVQRCLENEDYLVVLESEHALQALTPDFNKLTEIDTRGVIVTAPSSQYDFVNRFFAPRIGVNEDPVTGSAFTKLIPFWAKELGKKRLNAKQVSVRGGEVFCRLNGDRVMISGYGTLFSKSELFV